MGVSALAGTVAAPWAARSDEWRGATWLRSTLSLLVSVAILAVALPGAFGSVGGAKGSGTDPLRVFSSGPAVALDAAGGARLSVDGLVPGQSRTAVVRLSNAGSEPAALSLSARLSDRVAPGGIALSSVLGLRISTPRGAVLYDGALSGLRYLRLGQVGAGASRAFDFTVTLPRGVGNGVQGSTLGAGFSWTAG